MEAVFRIVERTAELDREQTRLAALLKRLVPAEYVHEVGSTAVKGVVGKQDLDFLVLVPAGEFLRVRDRLDQALKRNANQLSNASYQGYVLDSNLDAAVQLTVEGGEYDTFLMFLDLLRNNADIKSRYNQLKHEYDGKTMDIYRTAKNAFIENTLADHTSRQS